MRQRTLVVAFTFMLAISIASSTEHFKQQQRNPKADQFTSARTDNRGRWYSELHSSMACQYIPAKLGLVSEWRECWSWNYHALRRTLDVNGSVNVTSGYKMGGVSILSTAPSLTNVYFGNLAGSQNTSGNFNTFVGIDAGQVNTTGFANTFPRCPSRI